MLYNLVEGGRLVIIGAGAYGHEVASYAEEVLEATENYQSKIFFIDDWVGAKSERPEWPLIGSFASFQKEPNDVFIIALGDPEKREALASKYTEHNLTWATLIHPSAHVSKYAIIEAGCIIGPFCTVSYEAFLGRHVALNSYVAIGHHARIGDFSVLSPKVLMAGKSLLGGVNFIGSGAIVTPGKHVSLGAKVSAGSVVYRNVKEGHMVLGNPAKVISKSITKANLNEG